jgi:hypothetical protein
MTFGLMTPTPPLVARLRSLTHPFLIDAIFFFNFLRFTLRSVGASRPILPQYRRRNHSWIFFHPAVRFALSELCTQLHQTQASLVNKVRILAECKASKSKSQPSGTSSTLAPRTARQHHRDMEHSRFEPGKRMMMARSRMKAKRIKSAEEG